MTKTAKAKPPVKKPRGVKPTLPDEMQLVTRGIHARPDCWAKFFVLKEFFAPEGKEQLSDRLLFERLVEEFIRTIPQSRRARFDSMLRRALS